MVLPIGPQCYKRIRRFIAKEKGEFCFSPRDARNNGNAGVCYTTDSYRTCVQRAQDRAIRKAEEKQAENPEQEIHIPNKWTPHQLRHARGTIVRDAYGVEAAQAILGHERLETTQIYAEKRLELAKKVARQMG